MATEVRGCRMNHVEASGRRDGRRGFDSTDANWEGRRSMGMRSKGIWIAALACLGAIVVTAQTPAPAPAPQTGPGVQALNDSKYQAYVTANCKNPPPPRVVGPGRPAAPAPMHREYAVAAIPGVIAAGQT